ncbi:MAG TPA: mucoidy inhibitor MuiA family protein [Nitrospiria bacterium]|nr:mucoidy inhibitor MuiA family protein [Nitrospiria bacterium]
MKYKLWIFVLVFMIYTEPLLAKEIGIASKVSRVVVFSGRALVTRSSEVSVPKGENTLLIDGLPGGVLEQSLRVEGEASQQVTIGSVESRRIFTEELVREEERRITEELTALRDERQSVEDQIQSLKTQMKLIESIGQELPRKANEEIVQGKMDPELWENSWTTIGVGMAETLEGIRRAEIDKREIEDRIQKKERELAQINTGRKESVQVRVNIDSREAGSVRLSVSYQIWGASWKPLYDARLDEEGEKVTLTQLGQVRQNTGEDWLNVNLTLSTAQPAEGVQVPRLEPWFIDIVQISPALEKRERISKSPMVPEFAPPSDEGIVPMYIAPEMAQVVASEFAAEYRIPGTARVPSDNTPHKFSITEHELDALLAVQIAPKIAPRAFLLADTKYKGSAPLLPGPVSVFRGGTYIGNSHLEILRPGETVKLSFGVDDKVRVDYRLETGQRSKEGIFTKQQRVERRYRIGVENYHARPIEISLIDQVPVPQDERIKVELLKDSETPTKSDFDGRKGVLAWIHTYAPEEKRIIQFGYAVTFPEGENIPGF